MTHRFSIPIAYVHDSLDIAWDAAGTPFVLVQAQDHGAHTGSVVYRMEADGSLAEVLAPGADSWARCRLKVRRDGSGVLVGADAKGMVSVWTIPGWRSS